MATTKIVSVEATHPFIVRGVYARSIFRQALTIDEIYQCLTQQTSVTEHMPDGTTKRLDLSNYKDVSVKQPEVKTVKETPKVAPVPEAETKKEEEKPEVKQPQQNNNKKQSTPQKTNTNKK